jgi:hypothetical protein
VEFTVRWNPTNLKRHFDKHPLREVCWEEFVGRPITETEYENHSYRTAEHRCKVEFDQTRILDVGVGYKYTEDTSHFVDGMLFTTILAAHSDQIKTHFHIHQGGEHVAHETGATRWSLERQLDLLEDRLLSDCRTGRIEFLRFGEFAEAVADDRKQSLRKLEK